MSALPVSMEQPYTPGTLSKEELYKLTRERAYTPSPTPSPNRSRANLHHAPSPAPPATARPQHPPSPMPMARAQRPLTARPVVREPRKAIATPAAPCGFGSSTPRHLHTHRANVYLPASSQLGLGEGPEPGPLDYVNTQAFAWPESSSRGGTRHRYIGQPLGASALHPVVGGWRQHDQPQLGSSHGGLVRRSGTVAGLTRCGPHLGVWPRRAPHKIAPLHPGTRRCQRRRASPTPTRPELRYLR